MGYFDDLWFIKKGKHMVRHASFMRTLYYLCSPFILRRRLHLYRYDDSRYVRLNIGCMGKRVTGYVNIDPVRTHRRVIVLPFTRLPLPAQSVKSIMMNPEALSMTREPLENVVHEWERVLVPGGMLTVATDHASCRAAVQVCALLAQSGFSPLPDTNNTVVRGFHKEYLLDGRASRPAMVSEPRQVVPTTIPLEQMPWVRTVPAGTTLVVAPEAVAAAITGAVPASVTVVAVTCDTHTDAGDVLRRHVSTFKTGAFTTIILVVVPEYVDPCTCWDLYDHLQRILAPGGTMRFMVRHEYVAPTQDTQQFFDKAFLAKMIDSIGSLTLERLETIAVETGPGYVYACARKETFPSPAIPRGRKRLLALGEYSMLRYNQLGFHWDGQMRACAEAGLEFRAIDIMQNRAVPFLVDTVKTYRPDYLLIGLREGLSLVKAGIHEMRPYVGNILYWYCDPSEPQPMDLSDVVDVMFLSNAGQIPDYRTAYGIKRIFYLPQGFSPSIMLPYQRTERYDIAFTGTLSPGPLHHTRRACMHALMKQYVVRMSNTIRNTIAEFYGTSKLVFGASDFPYELYTSNRFFVALGCGSAYVCQAFPGIERLVEQRKHAAWFTNSDEMLEIVAFYLQHDRERHALREAAAVLARERHTYVHRIKNMLDIVEGKTERFYGFLS